MTAHEFIVALRELRVSAATVDRALDSSTSGPVAEGDVIGVLVQLLGRYDRLVTGAALR